MRHEAFCCIFQEAVARINIDHVEVHVVNRSQIESHQYHLDTASPKLVSHRRVGSEQQGVFISPSARTTLYGPHNFSRAAAVGGD